MCYIDGQKNTYAGCISVSLEGDVLILELKDFYTRYANDVIATVAFGIAVDSLKQPGNEFYKMGQELTYMGGFRAFKWLIYVSMPKLMQVGADIIFALVRTGRPDKISVVYSLKRVITASLHSPPY
jgi:hypothetical protein